MIYHITIFKQCAQLVPWLEQQRASWSDSESWSNADEYLLVASDASTAIARPGDTSHTVSNCSRYTFVLFWLHNDVSDSCQVEQVVSSPQIRHLISRQLPHTRAALSTVIAFRTHTASTGEEALMYLCRYRQTQMRQLFTLRHGARAGVMPL
jgi:hypothetical protein